MSMPKQNSIDVFQRYLEYSVVDYGVDRRIVEEEVGKTWGWSLRECQGAERARSKQELEIEN